MQETGGVTLSPTEWCHKKWEEAVEAGKEDVAKDYLELYNVWKSRSK